MFKDKVLNLLEYLSEHERLVISLHYYEDLKLTDVAQLLDLTQPRASQIHQSALKKLRSLLVVSRYKKTNVGNA